MKIIGIIIVTCTVLFLTFIGISLYALNQDLNREPLPMPKINAQGKYDLIFKMSESAEEVNRRNPNMFGVKESGIGPGFMRPVLPFDEILKVKVVIFGRDDRPVFEWEGFQDIRLVSDGNILELGIVNFLGRFNFRAEKLTDEEVYAHYAKILSVLKAYGWQPYVEAESPRIFGQDSWEVAKEWMNDGFYIDSYEKWIKYADKNNTFVMFKKDNLIAKVLISNYPSIEIEPAEAVFFFTYDEDVRVEHWKEYLQRDIPIWAKKRAEEEAKFKAKGAKIDETYIDYLPTFIKLPAKQE